MFDTAIINIMNDKNLSPEDKLVRTTEAMKEYESSLEKVISGKEGIESSQNQQARESQEKQGQAKNTEVRTKMIEDILKKMTENQQAKNEQQKTIAKKEGDTEVTKSR